MSHSEIVDALIARVRDALDRLKQLRTVLISAAVTGKVDVREKTFADDAGLNNPTIMD